MELNKLWTGENCIILKDLKNICSDNIIPWNKLNKSSILVTGATGLIGTLTVKTLLYCADSMNLNIKVGAYVRNLEKAQTIFKHLIPSHSNLTFEVGDISKELNLSQKYDYIIHAASTTASKDFIEHPVETINTTVSSTNNLLHYCSKHDVKSVLFLSSMEVYGSMDKEEVSEKDIGILETDLIRNCYPISKRLAENLCLSYNAEYNVHVKIARLTQTFGPGVDENDNRVFAQFAKAVINKTNIVLLTKGETKRDYLYTADAIKGILSTLLLGTDSEAYNVSNPNTYCSIYEMALLCKELANNEIKILFDCGNDKAKIYPKTKKIKLDISKLNTLNNYSKHSLTEQFNNLIEYLTSVS